MSPTISRKLFFALLAALLSLAGTLRAVTLDWDSVDWTASGLSQSYDVDPNNPGNDITITISGDTSNFNGTAPDDVAYNPNAFGTGLSSTDGGTGEQTLNTRVDWTSNTQKLVFTITFHYTDGVYLQQLAIFDIDRPSPTGTNWIDQIASIYGTTPSGTFVGPALITDDTATQVTGSGTNQIITGTNNASNNASGGNAFMHWGSQKVTQVTYTWQNASGTQSNPVSQIISLYDIVWTPIPEVGSSLAALVLCGAHLLLRRHRVLKRNGPQPA